MAIRWMVVLLLVLLPVVALAEYVGSAKSDRYHRTNCRSVQKISKENRITFATAEEAVKAGYKPCKKCNPPLPAKPNMPAEPVRKGDKFGQPR